jgi:hypothetical protein
MVVKVETTAANDTDNRMVVVKYAANGTIAWQKAVQFDANEDCRGADADIDADGNIYVCGNHDTQIGSAMSLVKFNSSGVEQWSRRVVGNCADFATSVVVGPDNNLYLSGVTVDPMAETFRWVVAKYSTTGSVVWQRLIENTASWTFTGGLFFDNAGGSNIAVGPDYVALAGGFGTLENDEDPTATVVQIDTNGTLFSIGDWALTAASFTGNLDDTASDITVVNAGKTAGTVTPAVADFVVGDDDSNFLIGTLYNAPGGNDSLVNGEYSVSLGNTGTLTLPSGGIISEGVVTSNPTIQLTPASPDVASQKLVIKGGIGGQYTNTENGIEVYTSDNTYAVSDSANFGVISLDNADQTLYWWIVPEESGISTTMSGTVELDGNGDGVFNFTVISDAYEFRVRVSPEEDNYDPENIGVESVLINGDAPAYGDYHLHLTTGDLTETSIFLGTDDHNVRTTTDGKIQVTTVNNSNTNHVWTFDTSGQLQLPGSSNGRIAEDEPGVVVYSDIGFAIQTGASTPMSNYQVQFTGFINDGTIDNVAGATLHVTAMIAGTITDGMTVYGAGLPPEGWELSFGSAVEPVGSGGTGTYVLDGANYLITSQSFNNGVAADIGPKSWIFDSDGDLRFPDNTVQTTAYVPGNTTATTPATSGIPEGFSVSTSNPSNLTPGSYPNILVGFDSKNLTLDIIIDESYNISIGTIRDVDPATFVVGDNAVLDGDLFGGTTPADDITITVSDILPTAIDLTKTINKLTDGNYTLADGVEGQIMYIVRSPETISENVFVDVLNGDGNNPLRPFMTNGEFANIDNTGICTLIFTDGTWKQTGGLWD